MKIKAVVGLLALVVIGGCVTTQQKSAASSALDVASAMAENGDAYGAIVYVAPYVDAVGDESKKLLHL